MVVTTWTANTASFTPVGDALARLYAFDKRTVRASNLIITPLWFLTKGPRGRHVRTPLANVAKSIGKSTWANVKQIGINIRQQSVELVDDIISRIPKRKETQHVEELQRVEEGSVGRHRAAE